MVLTNPVVISVVVLVVLCLLKVNVLASIIIAGLVAGLTGNMGLASTLGDFIGGMGGGADTALSYVLLGTLAGCISYTGLSDILAVKISKVVGDKRVLFLLIMAAVASMSQNLIPVHIAFIPILIPPLIPVMNKMGIDRRAVACALAFGLQAPYVALPFGFGAIYHGIIAKNMTEFGMPIVQADVWKYTWTIGVVMFLGLLFAIFFMYRKPREYKSVASKAVELDQIDTTLTAKHWISLLAAVSALVVQLVAQKVFDVGDGALALGALVAISIMFITRTIVWKEMDNIFEAGVAMMGFMGFVMMASSGFSTVLKNTEAVDDLVAASVGFIGNSKMIGALIMMTIGLLIVVGTGTSFGTVPVLSVLFVPLCATLGFSVGATTILIAAASTIGDAGSPASDTALGPTAGLNVDGQHDHIWDTCIPSFIVFNIPIFVWAVVSHLFF